MSHALINDLIIMQTHTEMRQTYFESKFSVKKKMSADFIVCSCLCFYTTVPVKGGLDSCKHV